MIDAAAPAASGFAAAKMWRIDGVVGCFEMRLATSVLAVILAGCGGKGPPPAVSPAPATGASGAEARAPASLSAGHVVGSWRTPGADFEELTVETDGSWSSFLHARPMYSGTWILEGDSLTLRTGDVDEPLVLSQLTASGDHLEGIFLSRAVRWTRIAD